eukprot:2276068-Pleurochrysis_carterae.AAC.1
MVLPSEAWPPMSMLTLCTVPASHCPLGSSRTATRWPSCADARTDARQQRTHGRTRGHCLGARTRERGLAGKTVRELSVRLEYV